MTQVTSYQVPAHPSGLDMRTQLNAIVLALVGDNSGPTAPSPTYPGMMWGDTTANRLKRRTNANDAWVDLGPIDNFLADINTSVSNKVAKAGDTMTGALTLSSTGALSSVLYLKAGSYAPHIRSSSSLSGFEWVNGANNAVPMYLTDSGTLTIAQGLTMGNMGELRMTHAKGYMRMRGDAGIGSNGGMGIVNYAGNAWRFMMTDEGYWSLGNYAYTAVNVCNSSTAPDPNGFQGTYGSGYLKLNEFNNGGYADFMRVRSEDYRWRLQFGISNDYFIHFARQGGNVQFANDGNIYSSAAGVGWISNVAGTANSKAAGGARVQWDSGVAEWGPVNGPTTLDIGAPWVMEGWRTGSNGNWVSGQQWLRGVVLRNQ